jgi:hypothetical protein
MERNRQNEHALYERPAVRVEASHGKHVKREASAGTLTFTSGYRVRLGNVKHTLDMVTSC